MKVYLHGVIYLLSLRETYYFKTLELVSYNTSQRLVPVPPLLLGCITVLQDFVSLSKTFLSETKLNWLQASQFAFWRQS